MSLDNSPRSVDPKNEELERSASLVRATLEATADGILVIDQDEKITGYNQVFLDLWRIKKGDIENRGYRWALDYVLEQLIHPEACLKRLQEIGSQPHLESHDVLVFKDGRIFERYSRPQKLGNEIIGRVFSYRDVTTRARIQQALLESEARKRAILDSAIDSIITMDHEGNVVELNPAAEKTFGYSQSDALGKELAQLIIPPQLRKPHREGLKRYLASGEEHIFAKKVEFPAINADGKEFPVEISISRIPLPGNPVFTGFIRDISERKQYEEQLRHYTLRAKWLADISRNFGEARLDLNTILDVASRRLTEFFNDGCIVRLLSEDKTQLRIAAFRHADPEAHQFFEQILPQTRAFIDEVTTSELLKTGKSTLVTVSKDQARLHIKSEFWPILDRFPIYSWIIVPLQVAGQIKGAVTLFRFQGDQGFNNEDLIFIQEVADRAALAVSNAQLYLEAQKAIQLREDFISIASHELRTPLTPLKLQLQLLSHFIRTELVVTDPKPQRLQKLILDSDRHMSRIMRLVEDMLDASRLRTGHLTLSREDVDLVKLTNDVLEGFRCQLASAKCVIELQTVPTAYGFWDRLRLEQVISNLLSNAIKYGAGKPIKVSVSKKGNTAILSVQDFGVGIAKEDQPKLFERFGRVASLERYGGLGMGLYISRQIIEEHGGSISLESIPGKGSIFTVTVPEN